MSDFLNSILKTLPAVQAKQISNLLTKLQIAGEIKNTEEYSAKLQELSALINDSNPIPSFNYIPASIWASCSSQAHNYMMTLLKNDIEALYLQLNEMGQKIDDNNNLILKSIANDLLKNIETQENKINEFKWIANKNNEFNLVSSNTFKLSSSNSTERTDLEAKGLYYDNRTYIDKTESELPSAVINESSESLELKSTDVIINPISVKLLSDQYSYGNELDSNLTNIDNLIDNTFGTYWTRSVYLSNIVPKVNTVLEFTLGNGKNINYIHVDNGSTVPIFISSIIGIKSDNSRVTLLEEEVELFTKKQINFDKQFLKAFEITFTTYTYEKSEYYSSEDYLANEIISNNNKDLIMNFSKDSINSKSLSDLCNITEFDKEHINKFLYSITLDNIYGGYAERNDIGIFISKPLKAKNIGIISVNSEALINDTDTISNNIEFEIIKRDRFPSYKETKFSIPVLNQTQVYSERFIPIKKTVRNDINDTGILRFCPYVDPDWAIADESPITLYENNTRLRFGDPSNGYEYATQLDIDSSNIPVLRWIGSNWLEAASFANYKFTPQKMWIKLANPNPNAIYTVSYKIRTSDSYINDSTVWLDEQKTIFLSDKGRVVCFRDNLDIDIDSDIYTQITLRKNSFMKSMNVELPGYTVLGSIYNKG